MEKVELPTGGGIYVIEVGAGIYVGQTKNFNTRLSSHIRNAYNIGTNNENESVSNLYHVMGERRLQDLKITLYDRTSNYGIVDFDRKFLGFLAEWEPVGKRFSKNNALSDESLRLDFAEIYHIMHYVNKGTKMYNAEMGGQVSGWTAKQKKVNSILRPNENIKLLTRQTPPKEAYQTFLRGAAQSIGMARITEEIYDNFFDDDWAEKVIDKFLGSRGIGRSYASKTTLDRRINLLRQKKYLSWSEFFETRIIPYIERQLPAWVGTALINKKGVKTVQSVRTVARKDLTNFVQENFLKSRAVLAKDIVLWLFEDSGTPEVEANTVVEHFDFSFLGEYIAQLIETLVVSLAKDNFAISNNNLHHSNIKHFKPIRFSVVWKSSLHKDRKNSSWIDSFNVDKGRQVSEKWLKYRSLLMFDKLMDKSRTWIDIKPVISKTLHRLYIPMFTMSSNYWLSAKLHAIYNQYAPGYSENWLDFYRPMVSLWRNKENRPLFKQIKLHDSDYLAYESETDDILVIYSNIKNFIDNITEFNDIKIY